MKSQIVVDWYVQGFVVSRVFRYLHTRRHEPGDIVIISVDTGMGQEDEVVYLPPVCLQGVPSVR